MDVKTSFIGFVGGFLVFYRCFCKIGKASNRRKEEVAFLSFNKDEVATISLILLWCREIICPVGKTLMTFLQKLK